MPTITISDEVYAALTRKAAAVGVSPGEFIALTLSGDVQPPAPPTLSPDAEARRKAREQLTAFLHTLAAGFPPGHETDVSREAMYEERLRAQL